MYIQGPTSSIPKIRQSGTYLNVDFFIRCRIQQVVQLRGRLESLGLAIGLSRPPLLPSAKQRDGPTKEPLN